jgi:two-component system, LytTR family, response regulator
MSAPIRVLVADDELLSRRMLRALVERDPELALVGEAKDGQEAEALLEERAPELALLDVMMPGCDGFAALKNVAHPPAVIFITAHPEHAVRAFEVEAVDYLLKPFDDARFERAIARGKEAAKKGREPQRIPVKEGRETLMIDPGAIDWIEATDYYVTLHVKGREHLVREPLHELERRLDRRFARIHRSAIVNLERIEKLVKNEAVVLQDGTELRISRNRRAELIKLLNSAVRSPRSAPSRR